jgi:hypothetical protein
MYKIVCIFCILFSCDEKNIIKYEKQINFNIFFIKVLYIFLNN